MLSPSSRIICESAADLLALYDVNAQVSAIEDLVAQGVDISIVLRLLCLASIVTPGIKPKVLENLKREILQVGLRTFAVKSLTPLPVVRLPLSPAPSEPVVTPPSLSPTTSTRCPIP